MASQPGEGFFVLLMLALGAGGIYYGIKFLGFGFGYLSKHPKLAFLGLIVLLFFGFVSSVGGSYLVVVMLCIIAFVVALCFAGKYSVKGVKEYNKSQMKKREERAEIEKEQSEIARLKRERMALNESVKRGYETSRQLKKRIKEDKERELIEEDTDYF